MIDKIDKFESLCFTCVMWLSAREAMFEVVFEVFQFAKKKFHSITISTRYHIITNKVKKISPAVV